MGNFPPLGDFGGNINQNAQGYQSWKQLTLALETTCRNCLFSALDGEHS